MISSPVLAFCSAIILAFAFVSHYVKAKRRFIKNVRGPPSPSWLLGNELEVRHQSDVGDVDFKWMQEFGAVWRTQTSYGGDNLYIADPKALQYVLQTSGYHYPKNVAENFMNKLMMGRGLVSAIGEDHRRQKKVMNPVFTSAQLKSFVPLFRDTAVKMSGQWTDVLETNNAVEAEVNVSAWLARTTLDVICKAAFNYDAGALDRKQNELAGAFNSLMTEGSLYPSARDILYKGFLKFVPNNLLDVFEYMPTRQDVRRQQFLKLAKRIAKQLVHEKGPATEKGSKDALSVLVRSNQSEDPKSQMDEDEILSQMATLILAGHETTASTMSWFLYELAKHPDDQQKIREEIATFRSTIHARGDEDFGPSDFEAMSFTNAALKETLRLYPIAHNFNRYADRDDVIPLAEPIILKSGETASEIKVTRGQAITVSVVGYNRVPSVWGNDAHTWNPMRFLETTEGRQTSVGVYANLASFSGGIRACIGWRFAVFEMQAIIVELLEKFHFNLPEVEVDIQRAPAQALVPLNRNRPEDGPQMPLRISLVH
ncbi:cytochrome P450 [Hygrophoropsis aurantiaca]|uniref:Cytochrome P450 n=1 Tax=Hygrophoropsis aurantiaca TaxID=72124 RepID=A0ACB8AFN8_9AGAM|nr:cytochrome P450 [Hygrophoropsis aurantiaca]